MSSEITRGQPMVVSVKIENAREQLDRCNKPGAEGVSIAQHSKTKSKGTAEECLLEYNAKDSESTSEWEKEVSADQQYWEQNMLTHKGNSSRTKRSPQRLTIREINIIASYKTTVRDPSYYKFDISTTAILKKLINTRYLGPLHNVVSESGNSVVIHSSCPDNSAVNVTFSCGNAVKIYKMTNNVKKNIAILKRARREYEHLRLLPFYWTCVVQRMKNVLIFGFVGENQETTPSITNLAPEHFNSAYQLIISDMRNWYDKCNIVHGNLCSKSILFDNDFSYDYKTPFYIRVIGWGHSVKRDHPQALIKLMRDCHFVTNFFKNRGVPVKSAEELFKDITGLQKISSKVMEVIHKKELWEKHLTNPNR